MTQKMFKNLRNYFREYCSHTSVHGFQYIGEKKRTLFERIWWFIIFVICITGCYFAIYAVYKKWEDSPVIVNFANKGTPIYTIPFPTVTICPESKSRQDRFNFTKVMQKKENGEVLTKEEDTYFEYMSVICNYYSHLNYTNNATFPEDFLDTIDYLKPDIQFHNCTFLNQRINCSQFIMPILTEEGICYVFNILHRRNIYRDSVLQFKDYHSYGRKGKPLWSLQNGYVKKAGFLPYPLRAYLPGAKFGLSVTISTSKKDLDYGCRDSIQGYKVMLRTPVTIPPPTQKYFRVPLDQSVLASVDPVMITTSRRVQAYNPEQRKCFFDEERNLKFFKNYTASNCRLECLANFTLLSCGCVGFYMPRENGTKICGTGRIKCMKETQMIMNLMFLRLKISEADYDYSDYEEEESEDEEYDESEVLDECNCLPLCSDLSYEVGVSQTNWEWKKLQRARRDLPQFNENYHLSSLTLFFKSDNFITTERNELYGPMDFLSNFGGLLGLFTGFSILSLMEIIYFVSIRVLCNFKLYGQWAGPENS